MTIFVSLVMLLVAFVGWVIVRYSQTYLNAERGEARYVAWLLTTLAAVLVVVTRTSMPCCPGIAALPGRTPKLRRGRPLLGR